MATSISSVSGLASGVDWQSLISQMMAVERQPETLMTAQKTTLNNQYKEWSTINTKLASLQTSATALATLDDFNLFTSNASVTGGTTTDVADLATFTVGSNASAGTYSMSINNLAQAQKLGSKTFSSLSNSLNISGDLVLNGRTVNISDSDSLTTIKTKINALNSGTNPAGVTASIITLAPGQYQLTLTSQNTGKNGMVLANGSETDVLGKLGIADSSTSLRNLVTGGALSAAFSSSTESIQDLLGLTSGASGTVTIAGVGFNIDLSSNSLEDIKDNINGNADLQAAGVSAAIISQTSSGATTYTLQIKGTQTVEDSKNILQTLGVLKQGTSDVNGVVGNKQNTTGGSAITSSTLLKDIDGYSNWTADDTITIEGTNHSGGAVGPISPPFAITDTTTVGDLLSAINTAFGNQVSAYVNSSGAIVVEDNQAGASNLAVSLTSSNTSLNLGTFDKTTGIRKRELTAGADAQINLDGNIITRSTNQISDIIAGTTLKLVGADKNATITLDITQDTTGIQAKISDFVQKYNALMTEISSQSTYSQSTSSSSSSTTTIITPPLFGDSTLQTIKGSIRNTILSGVSGVSSTLNRLSLVGISIDKTGQLSIDSTKLNGYLATNLNDVENLFVAQGTSTNSNLTYITSGDNTAAGAYQVHITKAASKASIAGSALIGSLTQDTNLTITDSTGKTAQLALKLGSNISDIVDAINAEVTSKNQILVGSNQLYADAGMTSFISNNTTLDSIYDSNGPVSLTNGDKISFTGTDHIGVVVKGSFSISNTSTQTVGDLLSSINNAYGTGYNASIDSQGRITIKDLTTGTSNLSLNITSGSLDFGTIGVNSAGTDGSQSGRDAMGITAGNDSGRLTLTGNSYGAYSFTVATSGQDLGVAGPSSVGNDVQGEIRLSSSSTWMTMTGSGQTLTGDAHQVVAGLMVKYTGTTAGIDSDNTNTFGFAFTKGVGSVLSQTLEQMSDSVSGYVTKKEQSLQTQMSTIDKNISDLEDRITLDQEAMTKKYVAMETMISQLLAQQSWLTSSIGSLPSWS